MRHSASMGSGMYIFCLNVMIAFSFIRPIYSYRSELSIFPIVVIRFRCCLSELVVPPYSVSCFIHIQGKLLFCFHCYCAVYDVKMFGYITPVLKGVFVCTPNSHYHYYAYLPQDNAHIWYTYKMHARLILSSIGWCATFFLNRWPLDLFSVQHPVTERNIEMTPLTTTYICN